MADFSYLSDSDDEKAVQELLSQAMDHSVLEQVAKINCSGFTDSDLPTHLETRFQKLKSFPATKPKSPNLTTDPKNLASSSFNSKLSSHKSLKPQLDNELKNSIRAKTESDSLSDDENVFQEEDPKEKKRLNPKLQSGFDFSPSKSSNSSRESAIFSPSKQNPDGKSGSKSKSQSGSALSRSDSWDISLDSLSPPQKTGCFLCSPKRVSRKKSKENRIGGASLDWGKNWTKNDEFLSDLSTFSTKEQQKMLKKAMKEEEKISREAEQIVKWAKQASARMDVLGIEDELSDHESKK
ncbi:unnamed protein product [Ilex paraguariensis]|uniref:Hepatoma-derived growth factor-related protein 2-like n=1 Tax=Ilex paraguariensis TaxID=185542 RepID=A0ABC8T1B7_9AQUA